MAAFTLTGACFASPVSGVKTKLHNQKAKLSQLLPKKEERNNVLGKFLKVMLMVCGSGVVIYLLGLGYKKISGSKVSKKTQVEIEKNLNSPETVEDAVKLFIEKF